MSRTTRLLPFLFFVVSGGCALVYEVTWAKYLGLMIGDTALANTCVLAAFMGGLALGSFYFGSLSARIKRPLACYGWVEVAIGLYAAAFPLLIHPVQSFVFSSAAHLQPGGVGWVSLKLVGAMLVLLIPTVLMGGTFPLLMRHFQPRSDADEDKSEWLYLANCAGAVAGALLAGFIWIPSLGLSKTLVTIGLANVLLGALAVTIGVRAKPWRSTAETSDMGEAEAAAAVEPASGSTRRTSQAVYAAIGLSGAAAMVYELVWIRVFAIVLGSSTYSFTLMVSAFITGIALGSLAVGACRWMRRNPVLAFAIAEAAIALTVLASIPLYERLPYTFWKWSSLLRPSPESFWLHSLLKYSLCFVVMVVPTSFFGATLPLAIKAAARRDDRIGRDSGFVYGANTIGAVTATLLTGLLLIPAIGVRHLLEVTILVNIVIAGLLVCMIGSSRVRLGAAAAGVVLLIALILMPAWHPASFVCGTFRYHRTPPATWADFRKALDRNEVFFYGEDGNAAVAVVSDDTGVPGMTQMILKVNGKGDASSFTDLPTQILVGQLPMILKPDAKDALVVGLGSGVSVASVLTHPGVTADCVEISPAVVRAASQFEEANNWVLDDSRLRLYIEDARTFTAVTPRKYDVVASEPTNPWIAGVGNLFSVEFFQSVDRILKPGGLFVQWFHVYENSDELVKIVLRTVRRVFPYTYVFQGAQSDFIVVASRTPIKPDFGKMAREMSVREVRADLYKIHIDSLPALLAMQAFSPDAIKRLVGEGPVNTDDLPILEYRAPVAQYTGQVSEYLKYSDERLFRGRNLLLSSYLAGRPLDRPTYLSLIHALRDPRLTHPRLLFAILSGYLKRWPDDVEANQLYTDAIAPVDATAGLEAARATLGLSADWHTYELAANTLYRRMLRAQSAFTPQDFGPAVALIDEAIRLRPGDRNLLRQRDTMRRGLMPQR